MISKWIASLMAWNRSRTYGVAEPPPSSCTGPSHCSACDGRGYINRSAGFVYLRRECQSCDGTGKPNSQ